MQEVVNAVVASLSRKLGDQLRAVYLYGSLVQGHYQPDESDINLLAVVADGTSIHAIRDIFHPIWREEGDRLRRAPLIAQESAFVRHLRLSPTLAQHLGREGQQLLGPLDHLPECPPLNPHIAVAHLASEVMEVSTALTPDLQEPEIAGARLQQLRRLARRLHGKPMAKEESAVHLFAPIQHYLGSQMDNLAAAKAWRSARTPAAASPLLPGLQAIYKRTDNTMVLAFTDLSPQQITTMPWQGLSQQLADQCTGLVVTTTTQLCLASAFARPLDLCLQRYQHDWGLDPLTAITPSPKQILRHAALVPSQIEVDSLPDAYLKQEGDEHVHEIIHDFQNKMLNIQLGHELLYRLGHVERFQPPSPLPDRTAPLRQRINAIFQHLSWWANHYTEEMMKA